MTGASREGCGNRPGASLLRPLVLGGLGVALIRLYLVSQTRLYRDGLADELAQRPRLELVGKAPAALDALDEIEASHPDVVLVDGDAPEGVEAVRAVTAIAEAKVIVLGLGESEGDLIAFAEAGMAGYVSREGSLHDLVAAIESVARGEMLCSPRAAATLLRRVTSLAAERPPTQPFARLTKRQLEIVRLIEQGLTNKEIARRLCIELPTVKNHLHSIFEKLDVHRRGEVASVLRSGTRTPV